MKKILALLMAVCLTVAMLAGCGSAPAEPVQGATAHVGTAHAPAGQPEQAKPDPVADLKAKLQEAISRENYEEAARLRDEIRRLEGQK